MNRGIAVQPTPRPAPRSREVLRPSGKPSLLRLLLAIATALPLFAAPVAAQAAVKLSAMSPQSGPIFGGNLVTVYGTGLDAITGVRNTTSGQSGTITEKSSTELTFRAPRANQEGGATLAFDSSEGAFQAPSNYMYYTLITSGPSPSTGPETGGTEITVLGRDLDQVISVQFSRGVGTIKRQSPTSITIVAPPTDSPYGTTVSLQFPNGYAAFPWNYDDVYTPPLVESLSPNHGSVSGGNSVTIRGQWIWGTKSVTFGTTDAPITESGNGYVTVTAPPARAGTALVKLTNREGTSVGTVYRYDPLPTPPTVSSLAPSRGPVAGGTNVVIAGANLATVTSVKFGAAAAAIVRKTAASVTVTAPAGAAGAATVTVVNPDGQATSNYTYDAPVPSDPVGPTPEPVGPTPEPVVPTPDPVGPTPEPGGSVPNPGGATPVPGGSVPEADPGTPNPGAGAPESGSGAPAPSGPAPSAVPVPPTLLTPLTETAPKCGSLSLKGKSLTKATSIIKKAGCKRGTVKKPRSVKKGRVLVVSTARLAKGSTTKVNLTLVATRR